MIEANMPKSKWLLFIGAPFILLGFLSAVGWRLFEIGQILADFLFSFPEDEAPSTTE